ncbi:HD-GYP domain-containing protein [Butyrivibrio sp. FCS014]|uniref:HD-GYP domain-containing protein n=1 Tax=Butyrivibrio sp. FCS014 TaxID=1408304 RepID=UPI000464589D|nr:HD domain-containing phosphohydrolase [Butyrivibrio sp. FCS014]
MEYTVAVVDDESVILRLVSRILSQEDIRVIMLNSGKALLDYMRIGEPDMILLDILMPEMDGLETITKLRALEKELGKQSTPVIFLTGEERAEIETKGLELGAMDFIKKPFVPKVLTLRVIHSIQLVRLQNDLTAEVYRKTMENQRLSLQIVKTLAETIDAKDTYTNGHSGRVAEYSREIARRFGYDPEAQSKIYMMGLLHDVGKIGIPDAIINKPGKLTDEEYAVMKAHPEMGAKILSAVKDMPELVTGARYHHERYDGKEYPDGLSGKDIPEQARMIAVADAYDAMSSKRSYRDPLSQDVVRAEVVKGRGTQFDPVFADIMLAMIDEDTDYNMREKDIAKL